MSLKPRGVFSIGSEFSYFLLPLFFGGSDVYTSISAFEQEELHEVSWPLWITYAFKKSKYWYL